MFSGSCGGSGVREECSERNSSGNYGNAMDYSSMHVNVWFAVIVFSLPFTCGCDGDGYGANIDNSSCN